MKITILGAGNIGSAFVRGLLSEGTTPSDDIILTDISLETLAPFSALGIYTMLNNVEAVKNADIVVICVKPYIVRDLIEEILPSLSDKVLLVSFAAGITLDQLKQFAGKRPLFRVIPNTAMEVCQSMTCIAVSDDVSVKQRDMILNLFSRVGKAKIIDESLMNAATVIASCGTAFALRFMRATMAAGVEIGFKPEVAQELASQTMLGAAALILVNENHPEAEIDKVTTPKGITIKGLNEMEHVGFSSAVMKGINASYEILNPKN